MFWASHTDCVCSIRKSSIPGSLLFCLFLVDGPGSETHSQAAQEGSKGPREESTGAPSQTTLHIKKRIMYLNCPIRTWEEILLHFAELNKKRFRPSSENKLTEEPFSVSRGPAADEASPQRRTQRRGSEMENTINDGFLWRSNIWTLFKYMCWAVTWQRQLGGVQKKKTGFSDRQITPAAAAAAAYILFLYTSDMISSLYKEKSGFASITAAILIWYDMAKKTSRSFAMIINSCITDGHFYPSLKCWKSAWYNLGSFVGS